MLAAPSVSVLSLVDVGAIRRTWSYSRADFAAMAGTIGVTWVAGIEAGLLVGVGLSIFLHLYSTSRPHVAVVGQIPGTAHFRVVFLPDEETLRRAYTRIDEFWKSWPKVAVREA